MLHSMASKEVAPGICVRAGARTHARPYAGHWLSFPVSGLGHLVKIAQGNVLKAKDDLEKVRSICGTDCRAYTMLKAAIDGTATY